ncbi:hypothetical protein KR009_000003, partial [Drosophila setifemur]
IPHISLTERNSFQFVAEEYALAFLRSVTSDPGNWCGRVSHQFVGQCFQVLGLKFNVSVEAFCQTPDHPYTTDNPNYVFDCVPFTLSSVDTFMELLPGLFAKYGDIVKEDQLRNPAKSALTKQFDRLTQPLPCYLQVVVKWMKVVQAVYAKMQLGSCDVDRFICEPLSRMSFSILSGLSKLLPKYGDTCEVLKSICLTLTVDVRYAILYPESCQVIITPMLAMFRENFRTFCGIEKTALEFVYFALNIEMKKDDVYISAYEFLEAMLKQFAFSKDCNENNQLYLRIFTNELITEKYLVIQAADLNSSRSKPLLMAILTYLMTLQENVVSTECFPPRIHEILLQLVLRMPINMGAVRVLAAEVYVKLSQRQYQNKEIVQHILEVYIKSQHGHRQNQSYEYFRTQLKRYLKVLIQHFPELQRMEFFAYLLVAPKVRIELSLITAQSLSILFEHHTTEYSINSVSREQVHQILRGWPSLLESLSHTNEARSVLFSIYSMVDFASVAVNEVEMLLSLETFCLDKFAQDDTLSESEFAELYSTISRSVSVTGNLLTHTIAARVLRDQQAQLKNQLNDMDSGDPQMPELLEAYEKSLRRLHSLLRANKLPVRYLPNIFEHVAKYLLEIPTQNDGLIHYGSESLALMLVLLFKNLGDSNDEMGIRISLLAQQLQEFCVTELTSDSVDLRRSKFMFCSILILHIGQIPCINFDAAIHDIILEQVNTLPHRMLSECNIITNYYVPEMHYMFRRLVKAEEIEFPSNRIWKIIMQYKMSGAASKYLDPEIEQLIGVLIENRIEIYAHCLSVIQLHIFNEAVVKRRSYQTMPAHLRFIEKHAAMLDSWLLRLIVLQSSLNFLLKNMHARRLEATSSKQRNRLLPLLQLLLPVAHLRLQRDHFKIFARAIFSFKEEAMGPLENSEIESFVNQVSKFKYECEDEHSAAENSENFEGKLLALPPGPFSYWQHKTLELID